MQYQDVPRFPSTSERTRLRLEVPVHKRRFYLCLDMRSMMSLQWRILHLSSAASTLIERGGEREREEEVAGGQLKERRRHGEKWDHDEDLQL